MVNWHQFVVCRQWHILLALMATLVSAQRYEPKENQYSVSDFVENKVFYVYGELFMSTGTKLQTQFFSIDLSVPWNTSSVPYKRLTTPGANEYKSATLSPDQQKLILLGIADSKEFDVAKETWRNIPLKVTEEHHLWSTVVDPNTGKLYALDGYKNFFIGKPEPMLMHEYDFSNGATKTIPLNPALNEGLFDFQVTWNPYTNKLAMFVKDDLNTRYRTFRTWDSKSGWTTTTTKGTPPFDRIYSCLVPAYNNTKLVLFGGSIPGSRLDDIYIFDIATATWTKGANAGSGKTRSSPACAVSNDHFIIWSGRDQNQEITSEIMLIYNIKTDKWQTTYTPAASVEPSTGRNNSGVSPPAPSSGNNSGTGTPSNIDGNASKQQPSNLAAIIGAASGGLFAIVCAAGLFIFLRRKRKNQTGQEKTRDWKRGHDYSPQPMSDRRQDRDETESDHYSDDDLDQPRRPNYRLHSVQHTTNEVQSQQKPRFAGRAPQDHESNPQFMAFDQNTLRQPEDTSGVTFTNEPPVYNRTWGNDNTIRVNRVEVDYPNEKPGNESNMIKREHFRPGYHPPMAIPIRDPQHPRGYGNTDPRSSQVSGYSIPSKSLPQYNHGVSDNRHHPQSPTGSNWDVKSESTSVGGTTLVHEYSDQLNRSPSGLSDQQMANHNYSGNSDRYHDPPVSQESSLNDDSHWPGSRPRQPEYISPRLQGYNPRGHTNR